jgi:hypothetical protein
MTIPQSEVVELFDPDKLLLLVNASREEGIPLPLNTIHTHVYLLHRDVGFCYHFMFMPWPVSYDLSDDLKNLREGCYIDYDSEIKITEKGLRAIADYLRDEKVKMIYSRMKEHLRTLGRRSEVELSKMAYQ